MLISKVLTQIKHRNFLVIVDTAMAAGSSVILLLGAARAMKPDELSDFSLVQLIVMTSVMLQRALFLSPALASQRRTGKSLIPVRWSAQLSLPLALITGGFISGTIGGQRGTFLEWFCLGFVSGAVVLVQDTIRFCLLCRDSALGAVVSDGVWLLFVTLTLFFGHALNSAFALALYWAASGLAAVAVASFMIYIRRHGPSSPLVSIRHTWQLGKWSGLDSFMSAAANLTPMLMTALVIGSEHAGTYRVLQSSLGPLNILSTSLITMLGLDSWKFVSETSLAGLRTTVRKTVITMTVFAVTYIALAEIAVISIAGLGSEDLLRIAVVVGVVGVLGAATSPLSAAALALGYQRDGAMLRLVIVAFSFGASLLGGLGLWLPWGDPIGTVTLFAATTGLIGWSLSYRRAMKKELKLLTHSNPTLKSPGRHMAARVASRRK